MIRSLQSLRFIFAVMIFCHHYGLFYAGGTCGVSFFMILSGFVMSAGYGEKVIQPDFEKKSYFIKRLIRLYPLHLLCLLGFILINVLHYGISDYIKLLPNVFLIQSWIPISSIYFSGNSVSWCLSDMLFFYGMFPLLTKSLNFGGKKNIYIIIALLLFYLLIMLLLPDKYCHSLLYISPIFRLMDFLIGMMTFKYYIRLKGAKINNIIANWSYVRKSIIESAFIFILTIVILLVYYIQLRYSAAFIWWFVIPELILLFALFDKSGGIITKFLNNQYLVQLGGFSFSFFMIHQLAINGLRQFFEMMWPLEFVIIFSIVVCVSYVVYNYYEIPVAKYLKRKLI